MGGEIRNVILGDIASVTMGQSPPSKNVTSNSNNLPFLQGNAEFGFRHPIPKAYCEQPPKSCKKNDILISVRAPVGDVNIAKFEIGLGRGLAAISTPSENRNFLYQYLKHIEDEWGKVSQGSTFEAISGDEIRNTLIPCFAAQQQKQTAALLDSVDSAIETTRKLIEQIGFSKAGLMQKHLLSNSKETKQFKLGELFSERNDSGRKGLPILSVSREFGLVPRESLGRKVESNLKPEQHLLVRENDIAYNMMRMWQGVSGLATCDGLISPAYVVVTPNEKMDATYASYLFKVPEIIRLFHRYSQGLTNDRLRLYFDQFKDIQITIPESLEKQQRIAQLLVGIDERVDELTRRKSQLTRLKTALSQKIFTPVP